MSTQDCHQLLQDAIEAVLAPLARLAVAQGLPYPQAEELLKRAYVRAARDARGPATGAAGRDVSQVSVATGIGRREVKRITDALQPAAVQRPAPATRLFLRWLADASLRDADGRPRALPRQGAAPSFEALAQSVTRHVHPRSLLDELCRLGLAELIDDGQTVRLLRDSFVPPADDPRLLAFVGHNVGDHLAAAAANVQHRDRRHLEQAVYTDELSEDAARAVRALAQAQWQQLLAAVVPALEKLIEDDRAQGRPPTHRARLGLYSYQEPLSEAHHEQASDPPR
jgi:Family of unknown function (DUF6502)